MVEPVMPYAIDMANTIRADARAPNKKYLIAASFELGSRLWNPARTYVGMLISSHATNSMTKSVEYATSTMPIAESSMSE